MEDADEDSVRTGLALAEDSVGNDNDSQEEDSPIEQDLGEDSLKNGMRMRMALADDTSVDADVGVGNGDDGSPMKEDQEMGDEDSLRPGLTLATSSTEDSVGMDEDLPVKQEPTEDPDPLSLRPSVVVADPSAAVVVGSEIGEESGESGVKRKLDDATDTETLEVVKKEKKEYIPSKTPHLDEEIVGLLPDLQKYWKPVEDDPSDFSGWTHLLQYVDHAVRPSH